jgi:ribonucleotide monophosphatase NagD (HAD superfamily)
VDQPQGGSESYPDKGPQKVAIKFQTRYATEAVSRPYFLLSETAKDECISAGTYDPDVPYDAVIVGLAPTLFDYDHLNSAFRILVGEDDSQKLCGEDPKVSIPLIALHKARYIESSGHGLVLGPGPFVAALENATEREAEVLGKPSKAFFETVIESLDCESHDPEGCIAVIGDDIQMDLGGGAKDLCLWRILGIELICYNLPCQAINNVDSQ